MAVHALISQCALSVLSYSECKITRTFRAFAHGPHWGGPTASPLQTPCHTTKNFLDKALSLQLRQRWMIKQTKSAIRCPSKSVKYMKLFS